MGNAAKISTAAASERIASIEGTLLRYSVSAASARPPPIVQNAKWLKRGVRATMTRASEEV
ncbi:hypothetical protein SAMN05446635_8407 [Burkholderia sp. OK233]|nr:hypothetical protein SAMN05446635_8407 [Burkholderia sp. OK233]